MSAKKESVKIGKLDTAFDYIEWKRSIKAYLSRDDFMLVGIRRSPENTGERETVDWNKAQIIAKQVLFYIWVRRLKYKQ